MSERVGRHHLTGAVLAFALMAGRGEAGDAPGPDRVVTSLREVLTSQSAREEEVADAVRELGRLGERARPSADELLDLLALEDYQSCHGGRDYREVRAVTLPVLTALGVDARGAAIERLERGEERRRGQGADMLKHLPPDDAVVDLLAAHLDDPSPWVRERCLFALQRHERWTARTRDALTHIVATGDGRTSALAVDCLLSAQEWSAIERLYDEGSEGRRQAVAWGLRGWYWPRPWSAERVALLERALDDEALEVRAAAAGSLVQGGAPALIALADARWSGRDNPELRSSLEVVGVGLGPEGLHLLPRLLVRELLSTAGLTLAWLFLVRRVGRARLARGPRVLIAAAPAALLAGALWHHLLERPWLRGLLPTSPALLVSPPLAIGLSTAALCVLSALLLCWGPAWPGGHAAVRSSRGSNE